MSHTAARDLVSNNAILHLPDGQTVELPVMTGTENENAEQMMQHCQRFNARSVACFDGQIWMTEASDFGGRYTLALGLDFVSWNDLRKNCDEPACEIDGIIQASKTFNQHMSCSVGEIVFEHMGWPQKLHKEQCILGHEIVHAFGVMHPREL